MYDFNEHSEIDEASSQGVPAATSCHTLVIGSGLDLLLHNCQALLQYVFSREYRCIEADQACCCMIPESFRPDSSMELQPAAGLQPTKGMGATDR